jgi:hypothetical protein
VIELVANKLSCHMAMPHLSHEETTLVDIEQNFEINSGDCELEVDYAPSPPSTRASDLLDNLPLRPDKPLRDVLYSMLNVLDDSPYNFMDILPGLFYGNETLRTDLRAKSSRNSVFTSGSLYTLFTNMAQPPRTKAKGTRAKGAKDALETSDDPYSRGTSYYSQ